MALKHYKQITKNIQDKLSGQIDGRCLKRSTLSLNKVHQSCCFILFCLVTIVPTDRVLLNNISISWKFTDRRVKQEKGQTDENHAETCRPVDSPLCRQRLQALCNLNLTKYATYFGHKLLSKIKRKTFDRNNVIQKNVFIEGLSHYN